MAVDEKVRTESSISCQLSDVPKAKENIPLNDSPNPKEVFEQIHKKDCINIKNNLTNILSSASDSNFINKISSNTVFNSHGELPFSKNQTAKPQPLTKFYIGDDNCIHNSKQSLPDEKNNNVLKNNTNIVLTTLDDNRRKDEKVYIYTFILSNFIKLWIGSNVSYHHIYLAIRLFGLGLNLKYLS